MNPVRSQLHFASRAFDPVGLLTVSKGVQPVKYPNSAVPVVFH